MSTLRDALDDLAATFTSGVLAAIRTANIQDLLAEAGTARRGPGRGGAASAKRTKGGRLARRSAEDVEKVIVQVVALLKKNKAGLRSEQIRKTLGLDVREVPRVLKQGVASKKLASKGQKRATTYFAR